MHRPAEHAVLCDATSPVAATGHAETACFRSSRTRAWPSAPERTHGQCVTRDRITGTGSPGLPPWQRRSQLCWAVTRGPAFCEVEVRWPTRSTHRAQDAWKILSSRLAAQQLLDLGEVVLDFVERCLRYHHGTVITLQAIAINPEGGTCAARGEPRLSLGMTAPGAPVGEHAHQRRPRRRWRETPSQ